MDNKIIKYKFKKNKIEEKIIDMLNLKKEYYENSIINSNDNNILCSIIDDFLLKLKSDNNIHLIIIIFGAYSVGKTTFLKNFENYIKMLKIHNQLNYNLVEKISIKNINDVEYFNNDNKHKITIIECDDNIINNINMLIPHKNVININIIPKNKNILKIKLANKIIYDIKNKTTLFYDFLNNINFDKHNIINNIIMLKKKNNILTDNDFDFLDELSKIYYNKIINDIEDYEYLTNLQKYFL